MVNTEAGREAIAVLTAKGVATILREGGSCSWVLDPARARRCRWLVCTRNGHPDEWAREEEAPEPHRSAFLVGTIRDVVPSPDHEGRWLVRPDRYALADLPEAWRGWRNPVRYTTLDELGVDPAGLEFRDMPPAGGRRGAPFRPAGAAAGWGDAATHDRGREARSGGDLRRAGGGDRDHDPGVSAAPAPVSAVRKPITYAWPSAAEPVRAEQASFLASLAEELVSAWRSARGVAFRDLPEYGRFIRGAYACGFVCADIDGPAFEERMVALTRDVDALRRADFPTVRMYVHTLTRSERFGDAGGSFGGGSIHPAVESGALLVVAERLRDEPDWRRD